MSFAALLIITSASCGGQPANPSPPPETEGLSDEPLTGELGDTEVKLQELVKLKMGAGGVSGMYYSYAGAISGVLQKRVEGLGITVMATQASKADILSVRDAELDMAIVQNDVCDYARRGASLFTEKVSGFSAITGLYAETVHIVAKPGVESLADLRGRSVSIGETGSGVECSALQILEACGLKAEDVKLLNLGFGESAEAFLNGEVDAIFCVTAEPNAAIAELAEKTDIVLLEIDDASAENLIAKYPFYTKAVISGSEYRDAGRIVRTVALRALLIVSDSLSEDVVYSMTKALFTFRGEVAAAHPKGGYLNPASALEGVTVPLHPGAEKYYIEIGIA